VFYYAIGVIGAFLLLSLAGRLLQVVLRRLPQMPSATWRNAFRGIYRPGSPAPTVIMSLGLGLAMLLVIVILTTNIRDQLTGQITKDAPTFVATDLFDDELDELSSFLTSTGYLADFKHQPMIYATVSKVKGVPSTELLKRTDLSGETVYFLGGAGQTPDILMTWSPTLPSDSRITAGQWWDADYSGPPLVSIRDKVAQSLGVNVGDKLELTLFGDPVEVTVANLRDFEFQNGINFMVTASPGTFDAYPLTNLATIKATEGHEKDLERALVRKYRDLTFLPIGEALNQAAGILGQLSNAVNIVGGLAVLNGLLVLAGTMAAGRKQREADAVVNKVLGATRGNVVRVFALEYGLLGAFSAFLAAIVGTVGAYGIIKAAKMDVGFAVNPSIVVGVMIGAILLTIITGALTTWSALSTRPAQYLRALG
jgi:putative ABC transport system permease protein